MQTIADHCQELPVVTFAPGDVLLPEGTATGRLYVLLEGDVEIVRQGVQINTAGGRGAIFGDMSALLDCPHTATVRALTACTAHVSTDGAGFLQSHPEVAYLLAGTLAQRLQNVSGYLVELKRQFGDDKSHLSMVDEILEDLLNQQRQTFTPGSDRDPWM